MKDLYLLEPGNAALLRDRTARLTHHSRSRVSSVGLLALIGSIVFVMTVAVQGIAIQLRALLSGTESNLLIAGAMLLVLLIFGAVAVVALAATRQQEQWLRRLEREGVIVRGTFLQVEVRSRGPSVVHYRFQPPDAPTPLKGACSVYLRGIPPAGTPLAILYVDAQTHMPL